MKKFDIKDSSPELNRAQLWNLVYERDDTIRKITRAMSAGKKNNCIAMAEMLEAVIHEKNEMDEFVMRCSESVQEILKENQYLRGLTKHFTISSPKKVSTSKG